VRWDLFCRVIDNLGDAGVCWRLATDLAARGESVRLVIDDAAPLARLAPGGAPRIEVAAWRDDIALAAGTDVVIEAFGCDPPQRFVAQMARAERPPCWINLEYLSAEPYAARSHGLASPQLAGAGRGLSKWFFYPGFTADTGGLLREPGLLETRAAFERDDWLRARGWPRDAAERVIVLFSYEHPGLGSWLAALSAQPTLLLVPQGPAQGRALGALGSSLRLDALRAVLLPWLPQVEFDRLLWSADLNIVRGEDSLVRALWAGAPFVWQLYPQSGGAHRRKLQAFLERWRSDASAQPPAGVAALFEWLNAAPDDASPAPSLPALAPWGDAVLGWRDRLAGQSDLTSRLLGFVADRR